MEITITEDTELQLFIKNKNIERKLITHLTIYNCKKITTYSRAGIIGNLSALTEFTIDNCINLKHLPDNICQLRALTRLNIYNCNNITLYSLSASFGNLGALTTFKYCDKLTHYLLPNSICFCKNLQQISISNINMLPPSMILLEKLNEIKVIDKNYITTIQNINEMRLIWYRILKTTHRP